MPDRKERAAPAKLRLKNAGSKKPIKQFAPEARIYDPASMIETERLLENLRAENGSVDAIRVRLAPVFFGSETLRFLEEKCGLPPQTVAQRYGTLFLLLSEQEAAICKAVSAIADGEDSEQTRRALVTAANEREKTMDSFRIAFRYTGVT